MSKHYVAVAANSNDRVAIFGVGTSDRAALIDAGRESMGMNNEGALILDGILDSDYRDETLDNTDDIQRYAEHSYDLVISDNQARLLAEVGYSLIDEIENGNGEYSRIRDEHKLLAGAAYAGLVAVECTEALAKYVEENGTPDTWSELPDGTQCTDEEA